MNFNRYIIISILAHVLFTVLITATHSFTRTHPPVFDVKIVPPLETEEQTAVESRRPEVLQKMPVPVKKRRPDAPEQTLPPDTLYEGGTDLQAEDGGTGKDTDRQEEAGAAAQQEEAAASAREDATHTVPGASLFDRKTIEEFASKAPPPDRGLTFDTSEFKHRAYMRLLKERIESIWKYPREAERLGLSGDLYIRFSITKNGELGEIELVRTSGYSELDRAAMNALKKAFPWWPLPEDYSGDSLTITGHFIYIFGSTYIL